MSTATARKYIRLGFDWEEERQERRLGAHMAEIRHPGNKFVSFSRQRVRVARHRHKEGLWASFKKKSIEDAKSGFYHNKISVPVTAMDRDAMELRAKQIELHMILDLLPYATREEALTAMLEKDDRRIAKVGKKIGEILPPSALE